MSCGTYFINKPFPKFAVLALLLLLRRQLTIHVFERIRLPLRVLLYLWLIQEHARFIWRHYHDWDLRFWHGLLRGTSNLVLEGELQHVLNFEEAGGNT